LKHILRLNESLTNKELLDDLNGASLIKVGIIYDNSKWGIIYYKNNKKMEGGNFNSREEAHNFLIDNDIDYNGKEGFIAMKPHRQKQLDKNPYPEYQKYLLNNGLDF
jgi:hypothetical protein